MKKIIILKIITVILFCLLLMIGFNKAKYRLLWNDEIYSQIDNIENKTFKDILLLKISEGNVSPLFYLIQKGIVEAFDYELPFDWDHQWYVNEPRGQIILRINSVIFMSLAIALMFNFFSSRYSFFSGVYAVGLSLSSVMMWRYWVEARHYALWFFLTTIQFLLFIEIINKEKAGIRQYVQMCIINILLSLTVVMSVFQIFFVSILFLIFRAGDFKTKINKAIYFFFLCLLPASICFLCYYAAPKYKFVFPKNVTGLITASFTFQQMSLALLFFFGALFYYFYHIKNNPGKEGRACIKNGMIFLSFSALMLLSAAMILGFFKYKLSGNAGFQVMDKYFMYLAPVGIISSTVLCSILLKVFRKSAWVRINIVMFMAWVLAISFLKYGFGPFLF